MGGSRLRWGLLSCQDPHPIAEIPSNPRLIPLLLPQLCSDHPLRFKPMKGGWEQLVEAMSGLKQLRQEGEEMSG